MSSCVKAVVFYHEHEGVLAFDVRYDSQALPGGAVVAALLVQGPEGLSEVAAPPYLKRGHEEMAYLGTVEVARRTLAEGRALGPREEWDAYSQGANSALPE